MGISGILQGAVHVAAAGALLACALTTAATPAQPEVTFPHCATACQHAHDAEVAAAEARVEARVQRLTAGRDCWTGESARIPSTVLVHDVGRSNVHAVTLDAALRAASAGTVWVDARCA